MFKGKQEKSDAIFKFLVKEHGDRIYNLALMKSNQVILAEDITQETFIRVYKGLSNFRHEAQLGTWVYRIALNVCHTFLKKESLISKPLRSFEGDGEPVILDEFSNTEDVFLAESNKQLIRSAIAALPPKQSDVITLYYLKEFQYSEVAEIMDIPINTVKSHLRRAKENLRRLIPEVER